jgi:uncharacterized alkaline shock family protein YloU
MDTDAAQTSESNENESVKVAGSEASESEMPEMLSSEDEDGTGTIRISENVIEAIVRKYTLEVDGVLRFASGNFVDILRSSRRGDRHVVVSLEDEENVEVAVTIVVRFGVPIREVAEMVQNIIRSKIEELAGKQVSKVDVIVSDVEEQEEAVEMEGNDGFAEA